MESIVILISGRGSNLQALVDAARIERWPARIIGVISSRADARGLEIAARAGIPTEVIEAAAYGERDEFDRALAAGLERLAPDLVLLAGFMRILPDALVRRYEGRMLNIHPSLLPAFRGMNTHRQALAAGVRVHGATVHFVTAALDQGAIVAQAVVPVLPEDTVESLEMRVLKQEHRLYPRVVGWMLQGRITPKEGRVQVHVEPDELLLAWPGPGASA